MCLGSAESSNLQDLISRVDKLDANVRTMSEQSRLLVNKLEKPGDTCKVGLNSFIDFKKKLVREHPDLDAGLRERIIRQNYYQVGSDGEPEASSGQDDPQESNLHTPKRSSDKSSFYQRVFEPVLSPGASAASEESKNEYELRMCKNIREFFQIYSPNVNFKE